LHNGSTDQKDVLTVQTAKLTEWLNRKNKARNTTSSGAATTAATTPLEITSCAARRARDQTNGVDCGFWVCMYAAYLCIGIPCDIKEEMSKGSMNINHVRSWMIHCMDERGRQADGGQSNKVQVPSEPNTRTHPDGHISVDGTPEPESVPGNTTAVQPEDGAGTAVQPAAGPPPAPDLSAQIQQAQDKLDLTNTVLAEYEQALTDETAKREQAKIEADEIDEMCVKAEKMQNETIAQFEEATLLRNNAETLMTTTAATVRSVNSLKGDVDTAVAKTTQLFDDDDRLKWAWDGALEAQTRFDVAHSQIQSTQKGVQTAFDTAINKVNDEASIRRSLQTNLDTMKTANTDAETQFRQHSLNETLYKMQQDVLKESQKYFAKFFTDVTNAQTKESADNLFNDELFKAKIEETRHLKRNLDLTKSTQAGAVQQQSSKTKADEAKKLINNDQRKSKEALAAAKAASSLATNNGLTIMSLVTQQNATHDVALAFQHAAESYKRYSSVNKNEVANQTILAKTLASEDQQNQLEAKLTHANGEAELFKSVADVQTEIEKVKSGVREAKDAMDQCTKCVGEYDLCCRDANASAIKAKDHAIQALNLESEIKNKILEADQQALQVQVKTESAEAEAKYTETEQACKRALDQVAQIKTYVAAIETSTKLVDDACAAVTAACAAAAGAGGAVADAVADATDTVADATDAGADATDAVEDAVADAGLGDAGGSAAGGGAEAVDVADPEDVPTAAVVESYQEFCNSNTVTISAQKDILRLLAPNMLPEFDKTKYEFDRIKILHDNNREVTDDMYSGLNLRYAEYFTDFITYRKKQVDMVRAVTLEANSILQSMNEKKTLTDESSQNDWRTRCTKILQTIAETITHVTALIKSFSDAYDDLVKTNKDMQALIDAAKATPAAVTPVPAAVSPADATVVLPAEATVVSPADPPADPPAVTPAVEDASNSAAASIEPAVAVESFKDFCTRTQAEFTKVKGDFDAAKNAFTQAWQKLKKTIKTFEDLHDKNAQSKEATKALYDSTCTEKSQYFTNVKDKNYVATTTKPYTDKLTGATDVFNKLATKMNVTAKHNQDPWILKVNTALKNIKQCCIDFKTKEVAIASADNEITATIGEMQTKINVAEADAAAKAVADEAAARAADAQREAERAARKAAREQAEADRLAAEKKALEDEVAKVAQKLKDLETKKYDLDKSEQMKNIDKYKEDYQRLEQEFIKYMDNFHDKFRQIDKFVEKGAGMGIRFVMPSFMQ
jgi:trimeric autotransporter adhesin